MENRKRDAGCYAHEADPATAGSALPIPNASVRNLLNFDLQDLLASRVLHHTNFASAICVDHLECGWCTV
jgi:hypothetical protein